MPPSVDELDAVRREAIGNPADLVTLTDADIVWYWDNGGDATVLLTAALCCDMLANRAASNFRWNADGQSIDKTMLADQYRKNAIRLRARALRGVTAGSSTYVILRRALDNEVDTGAVDEFSA